MTLPDLRAFASTWLAAFQRPEALHLTHELPRTATEKVAKPELRSRVSAAADLDTLW